jgi:hypothetical protein
MRLLVAHDGRRYRFLNIESSTRDGSLFITVHRDGKSRITYQWGTRPGEETPLQIELSPERAKDKEITIHQSGCINFHETGRSIYVEPLAAIVKTAVVYRYRIPRISRLTPFDSVPDLEDCEFDLSDLADEAHSFSVFIAPEATTPDARAIKLGYLKRYALIVLLDEQPYLPPPDLSEHFVTLKPDVGTAPSQAIAEDQALIAYHQALQETKGLIVYGPNGAGVWQVVFAVPMRVAPNLTIELDNPALFVDDIERDSRVGTAMVRFKVKSRATKTVIRRPVKFRSIELNARLSQVL